MDRNRVCYNFGSIEEPMMSYLILLASPRTLLTLVICIKSI